MNDRLDALGLRCASRSSRPPWSRCRRPRRRRRPLAAAAAPEAPRDPPPPLPAAVLKDPKVIAGGEALWKENCAHCHGSKAYPGKAPKLQPHKYKPEFVWDRVHNGFKRHAALEGALQPRAGHLARRLGDERRLLAVR